MGDVRIEFKGSYHDTYSMRFKALPTMTDTAKLFTTGRSQAVRLPKAFRFEAREVFIRRDPGTGDVILSRRPPDWSGLFELYTTTEVPDDFLSKEERAQGPSPADPFEPLDDEHRA